MNGRLSRFLLATAGVLAATGWITGCGSLSHKETVTPGEQFFLEHVKPALEENCVRCHNGIVLPGRLDLSNRFAALGGMKDGEPFIVPGKPDQSLLITAVSRKGLHPKVMPRQDISLTEDQIGVLREWITDGAAWPTGEAGQLKPSGSPNAH